MLYLCNVVRRQAELTTKKLTELSNVVQVRAEGPKGQKQHALGQELLPFQGVWGKTCESSEKKLIVEPLKKERKKKMKKEVWKTILQVIIAVLTAVGTTLGVTSCMQTDLFNH